MKCYACDDVPVGQCRQCGRFFCTSHYKRAGFMVLCNTCAALLWVRTAVILLLLLLLCVCLPGMLYLVSNPEILPELLPGIVATPVP
ncbi:MAG: hypothetical protein KKA73_11010 [Chloroflexi bacterium]|nr:hypothetical protein [Chloroflexota bacterium]MBU1748206.1 hypothetical protein [Chloroflexota bacterium]